MNIKNSIDWMIVALVMALINCAGTATAQSVLNNTIQNGIPWYDQNGDIVNAHGACIVEDGGRFWLFGEWKSDKSNAFPGFSCYSSTDLCHWQFERIVLPIQKDGIMGPNRVGERVKVMRCPKTGKYVMFMHSDDMGYNDPYTAIAISDKINGEYTLVGPLMHAGQPVKRWDMGTFQDTDGKGYILIHHGPILRLSDDYLSVEKQVANVQGSGESPAMFKRNGLYYLLYSDLTSWEKNDNFYFTAPNLEGPWKKRGLVCPEGKLTYNSQATFVFPLKHGNDTTYMFMGDRWSYPRQASAATYVWLPMQFQEERIYIPEYQQFWNVNTTKSVDVLNGQQRVENSQLKDGEWLSAKKSESLRLMYDGGRLAIKGESSPRGCYARVSVLDAGKDTVYTSLVDFYSKYPEEAVRIITPKIDKKGHYTLVIDNTGDMPVWYDKAGTRFGTTGTEVKIIGIYTLKD